MNSTNLPSNSGTALASAPNGLDVLLVDDEPDIEMLAGDALRDAGHLVTAVKDGAAALELVKVRAFDLMICDVRLPKMDGLTLFRQTRQQSPDTTVILMTAFAAVQDAVAAVKEGAHDYLTKPFEIDEITLRVKRIAEHRALLRELEVARAELAKEGISEVIVGRSVQMLRLLDRVNTIAPSHAPVLLQGESGTGKELVARALHERGARRGKAFVAVNCAAFPETLLEAELFGHERGAFTGAVKKRDGRFRAAHGGTLLLDEVAEMSLPAQAKLLRVLQEGVIEPLGTNESVRVDVRVISATNRNLKERVNEGLFREDLYYRLNVLNIDIPPLRERKGDLPLLVQFFLKKLGKTRGAAPRLSQAAWTALSQFAFPGNVRQLEHAIQHALVLAVDSDIDIQHLPRDIAHAGDVVLTGSPLPRPLGAALKEFEREYLLRALAEADGKRTLAAEILGISRKNLWEKLRMHGFSDSGSGA
jgi:DNA-binding NtrC family response regulator